MKYIKVKWLHDLPKEPCIIYSELSNDMFELRKVEVFPDGSYGYASTQEISSKDTQLGDQVVSFEKINTNSEFHLSEIFKEEFNAVWEKAMKIS